MAQLYFLRRFPTKCIIWAKRGREIVRVEDRGRRFTNDKGEVYFRLKKAKRNTVPYSWEYFYNISTARKEINNLYLYSPSPALFFPIQMNEGMETALKSGNIAQVEELLPDQIRKLIADIENPKKVKIPIDEKIEQWLDWEGFRIYKNSVLTDYKSGFERYFPQIIFLTVIILVAIAAWIIFRGMEGIMSRAEASEARWIQNEEKWIQLNDRMLDLVESGKVPIEVVRPPPAGV